MHDATTTQPGTADNTLRTRPKAARLVDGKAISGTSPARTSGTTGIAHCGDAIEVLKAKRDRYKGAGKLIQARVVQSCIDALREVWK